MKEKITNPFGTYDVPEDTNKSASYTTNPMTDNKEMTIEDRADRIARDTKYSLPRSQALYQCAFDAITSCQQLYGGMTPEQVRTAIELLKVAEPNCYHWTDNSLQQEIKQFLSILTTQPTDK